MRHFFEILRGILDELSDQNAYRRHLAAHGAKHSAEEWRKFSDERYQAEIDTGAVLLTLESAKMLPRIRSTSN